MGTARAAAGVRQGGLDEPPLWETLQQSLIDGLASFETGETKQSLETEPVETEVGTGLQVRLLHADHPSLEFVLSPKQVLTFQTDATELLYGGSAGSGKSMLMRVLAIAWAHLIPGLQVYLFRRHHDDLRKNHMDGPTSFPELLGPWLASGHASINDGKSFIRIGRSKIHLCHLQHSKYLLKYQGAEIHMLLMDELTHFTASEYKYLRHRVRTGKSLRLPSRFQDFKARIFAATNPGGIGHNWVKMGWIDPRVPMEKWEVPRRDGGMIRQFIPARLEDNPWRDDGYEAKLEGIGNPALAKAMRYGDWNIVAGGFFDDIWNEKTAEQIVLRPFSIPPTWTIYRAFDWGSSKPFAVLWYAVSDGTPAFMADGERRHYPRGSIFVVAEWYGMVEDRPNEGIKLTDPEIARGIVEREREDSVLAGRTVKPGPADAAIYDLKPQEINGVKYEHSIAKEMARYGATFKPSDKSPGSRIIGASKMRQMLKVSTSERMEGAGLFIFDTCRHVIRTIPTLPRDEKKTDDVSSEAEDHCYDALRYACVDAGSGPGSPMVSKRERNPVSYLPEYVKAW